MMKINWKKAVVISAAVSALFFAVSVVFLSFGPAEFSERVFGTSVLESLVFGESPDSDVYRPDSGGNFISENVTENRDLKALLDFGRNAYVFPSTDGKDGLVFGGPSGSDLAFGLMRTADSDIKLRVVYDTRTKQVNFVLPAREFTVGEQAVKSEEVMLYRLKDIGADDVLKIGNTAIDLLDQSGDSTVTVGEIESSGVSVFRSSGKNMLESGWANFSNGLWTRIANDCSNTLPGKARVSMSLVTETGRGRVLELSSGNHLSCTNRLFPVKISPERIYRFSFAYRSSEGNKAQYYYALKGADGKVQKSTGLIETMDDRWHRFNELISPTSEFNGIQVYFYAPARVEGETVTSLYDSVRLEEFDLVGRFDPERLSGTERAIGLSKGFRLADGVNRFVCAVSGENLLAGNNSSFEDGLWGEKAGDCCNTKPGAAEISMEESSEASDGNRAMRLSSANHCACASRTFPVSLSGDWSYRLSFDYRSISGKKVQYHYKLRNASGGSETGSESFESESGEWGRFEKIIESGLSDADFIDIHLYASADGTDPVTVLYDNVRLERLAPKDMGRHYLYASQPVSETLRFQSIEFRPVSRWRNRVIIHGASGPFLLSYMERFDEQWKVYPHSHGFPSGFDLSGMSVPEDYFVPEKETNRQATALEVGEMVSAGLISSVGNSFISKNFNGSIRNDNLPAPSLWAALIGEPLSEETHYKINDYGNSWLIDADNLCVRANLCHKNPDGSWDMDMVIEFWPQRWFYLGLLISGTTLAGCLGYLGFVGVRALRRRRNGK